MKELCLVEEISPDSGKEILLEGESGNRYIALFRQGDDVMAYLNTCPHQGRSLNWAPDEFLLEASGLLVCPHHGACFDLANGICVSGPCVGASLTSVDIHVKDGMVHLSSS